MQLEACAEENEEELGKRNEEDPVERLDSEKQSQDGQSGKIIR